MRPLLDSLSVSREKLAFIVDATAAPVASIVPVSSWVGFEIGLIQDELDKIIEQEGTDDLRIKTSGMGVFLQSIKYRYVSDTQKWQVWSSRCCCTKMLTLLNFLFSSLVPYFYDYHDGGIDLYSA